MTRTGRPRTILVTGASGVVGTAVLRDLGGYDVIAAGHRKLPAGSTRIVQMDVTRPQLGLGAAEYRRLCDEVDVVVNAAAIVNFSAAQDEVNRVNVEGLGRVVELAADADALLVQVSTAFVARYGEAGGGARLAEEKSAARPDEYVASKHAGDQLVRTSGVDAVIVRPSVLIGDSRTGEIRQHQGVHTLAEGILTATLPFIPAHDTSYLDFVPVDVVSRSVRAIVDGDIRDGDYWLTGGDQALPVERFCELVVETGAEAGLDVPPARVVEPSIVDRLVRPAFEDVLSPEDLAKLDGVVAVCSLVMTDQLLPTSLGEIPGGPDRLTSADLQDAWRVSLRRLIQELHQPV
jgi:nucleoside-diphosphate-sugar epimerase